MQKFLIELSHFKDLFPSRPGWSLLIKYSAESVENNYATIKNIATLQ